jgi:hypothetical protein
MPSFFIGFMPDTLCLVPTVIVKLGRDTKTRKPAAIMLSFQWLALEVGMEIELFTHRP